MQRQVRPRVVSPRPRVEASVDTPVMHAAMAVVTTSIIEEVMRQEVADIAEEAFSIVDHLTDLGLTDVIDDMTGEVIDDMVGEVIHESSEEALSEAISEMLEDMSPAADMDLSAGALCSNDDFRYRSGIFTSCYFTCLKSH